MEQIWEKSHISRLFIDGGMAVNVMARMYGNVRAVSMAKPRIEREMEEAAKAEITNATAGSRRVCQDQTDDAVQEVPIWTILYTGNAGGYAKIIIMYPARMNR